MGKEKRKKDGSKVWGASSKEGLGPGREIISWEEREVVVQEDGAGQVGQEGQGLGVKVSEHGVRLPTANKTNNIQVNFAAKEGHGAPGTEAASRNINRANAKVGEGGCQRAEKVGKVLAGNEAALRGGARVEDDTERGAVSLVLPKVD